MTKEGQLVMDDNHNTNEQNKSLGKDDRVPFVEEQSPLQAALLGHIKEYYGFKVSEGLIKDDIYFGEKELRKMLT